MLTRDLKHIIIVVDSFQDGGAERVMAELANAWSNMGHSVEIVRLRAEMPEPGYDFAAPIRHIDFTSSGDLRVVRVLTDVARLRRLFKSRADSTIVAFLPYTIIKATFANLFVRRRMVVSERNDPRRVPASRFQRLLRDYAFIRASACVFQTEWARSLFPQSVKDKSVVIPNPVRNNLPDPFSGTRRTAVVTACRLEPQKNIPMLLEAFAKLRHDHPEFSLEVYGRGSLRGEIAALAEDLQIADAVSTLGYVEDLPAKMSDAALFVSTSDYEGISNSLIEALALGVPSVATDCPVGGSRESIDDGVNGLLVPVGDVEACYAAMKRIVEDPALAERMSANAATIREKLPLGSIARQWIDVM